MAIKYFVGQSFGAGFSFFNIALGLSQYITRQTKTKQDTVKHFHKTEQNKRKGVRVLEKLLGVREVAAQTGLSRFAIYEGVRSGRFPAIRATDTPLVVRKDLKRNTGKLLFDLQQILRVLEREAAGLRIADEDTGKKAEHEISEEEQATFLAALERMTEARSKEEAEGDGFEYKED